MEKVIVTARKRAEDAQTVPISITAFNQADLDKLNIKTVAGPAVLSTPSVYIAAHHLPPGHAEHHHPRPAQFRQPVGGGNPGLDFEPPSAVYKDGVYYARAIGLTGSLFDLDSVDVLKGPQGTLVGRNSTGGAILYDHAASPTQDFGGYVKVTGGDYGRVRPAGRGQYSRSPTRCSLRAALHPRRPEGLYRQLFHRSGHRRFATTSRRWARNKLARPLLAQMAAGRQLQPVWSAPTSPPSMTPARAITIWAISSARVPSRRQALDLQYSRRPASASPICWAIRSRPITPPSPPPASAASIPRPPPTIRCCNSVAREQTDGFWSTEQAHQQSGCRPLPHRFRRRRTRRFGDDIDVKLTGRLSLAATITGTAVSRGQPYDASVYVYGMPDYQSWQSELTVNGKALDNKLKWTSGLFFFEERSPNDGGYALSVPAQRRLGAQRRRRQAAHRHRLAPQRRAEHSAMPPMPRRPTASGPTPASPPASATPMTSATPIWTPRTIATPATAATIAPTRRQRRSSIPAPSPIDGITYAGPDRCLRPDQRGRHARCRCRNAPTNINKSFHKPTWTLALDHDLWDSTMVYATMRSGYRSGAHQHPGRQSRR